MQAQSISVGKWTVRPALNTLEADREIVRIQPRAMDLLEYLASRPGEVVSTRELIEHVWHGRFVVDHAVYRIIKQLRDALGDRSDEPRYIETVRRRGYRLIAPVRKQSDECGPVPQNRSWVRIYAVAAGACAVAALVAITALISPSPGGIEPQADERPTEVPFVVIADQSAAFQQWEFSDRFQEALRLAIGSSAVIDLMPDSLVRETLSLMRRDSGGPLRQSAALELAARARRPALVASVDIQSFGAALRLSIKLFEPQRGDIVTHSELDIDGNSDIDAAIWDLVQRFETAMSSELASVELPEALPSVTTDSLEALKLYKEALVASRSKRPDLVLRLTEAAVALDPAFASAEILHAWFLFNTLAEEASYMTHAERALSSMDSVSDSEALFIEASVSMLQGDFETAAKGFAALVEANPDHFWGVNNLAIAHQKLGNMEEAARFLARRSDLMPGRPEFAAEAARALAITNRVQDAARYSARAESASSMADMLARSTSGLQLARAARADVDRAWAAGDVAGMIAGLAVLQQELVNAPPEQRVPRAVDLADAFLVLGRSESAGRLLVEHNPNMAAILRGLVEVATEEAWPDPSDADLQIEDLDGLSTPHLSSVAIRHARLGGPIPFASLLAAIRRERLRLDSRPGEAARLFGAVPYINLKIAEGELLRASGDTEQAQSLLVEVLEEVENPQRPAVRFQSRATPGQTAVESGEWAFLAVHSLASIRLSSGDVQGAIDLLEYWGAAESVSSFPLSYQLLFLMRNRLMLSQLLEDSEPARSETLKQELAAILTTADPENALASLLRAN